MTEYPSGALSCDSEGYRVINVLADFKLIKRVFGQGARRITRVKWSALSPEERARRRAVAELFKRIRHLADRYYLDFRDRVEGGGQVTLEDYLTAVQDLESYCKPPVLASTARRARAE